MWLSLMGLGFYFLSGFSFLAFFNFVNLTFISLKILNLFDLTFYMDWGSLIFLGVLFLMVGSVMFFSVEYMVGEEVRIRGFMFLILLFVFSMVILMISGDWLSLIFGWDWLGISSFFLVAFYKSEKGWVGALKTFITKRLGDGFFIFLFCMFIKYFIFKKIFISLMLGSLVVILCQTKSAQLPFSAWLPAAMAAPTPVSALVHSSTLVTAGIYILIRSGVMIGGVKSYMNFMGLLTLFIGAFSACGSYDVKKMVAFSTLSHLGFMFVCMSSGFYFLGFFHLLTHACFKALLFMGVGMLMMTKGHCQDFRQMGVKVKKVFFIWCSSISVFSLMGFPFLSGFFSKDYALASFFWGGSIMFYMIFMFSISLSVFYSFRLIFGLLNMKWKGMTSVKFSSSCVYLLVLLFGSVSLGVIFSGYFKSLNLVMGGFFFKVLIYFSMVLGLWFSGFKFNKFVSSSISMMDSLGGGGMKFYNNIGIMVYKGVDQGVFPLLSEAWNTKSSPLSYNLSKNLFYYFWLFGIILLLVW